jgi:ACS family hexuronate transporter-like MFS transporter
MPDSADAITAERVRAPVIGSGGNRIGRRRRMSQTLGAAAAVHAVRKVKGLRWYICALLFFVTFINYVDRVSLGGMAPLLKGEIGWDDAEFGWINFSFQLSYALMFPIAGRLLDRIGVRKGLALGVIVWSVAAMSHSFATTVLGFVIARFILGLGEATNFPACVKAVAEWFPRRERSFATGIFNTGSNFGAMLQGPMLAIAVYGGWQSTFIAIGALGFVWLGLWWKFYRAPAEHPRLSNEEAALIKSDQEPPAKALVIPWPVLLRYREAWAFLIGKMLTDPVWWFYLTWLPSYLNKERGVSLASGSLALIVIYLAADLGSVLGGWLPGFLARKGVPASRARLITMMLFACGLPISAFAVSAESLWLAAALISLATACHQAWSANMFTIASDAFPTRAVASVVGFGGMCGAIGGLFMNLVSGGMLQWLGSYTPLFIFAGVMHPIAWISIRTLTGPTIRSVELRATAARSPRLLAGGLALAGVGGSIALLVWQSWDYVLAVTKNSVAAAAGGVAAGGLLALIGVALVYASREQRPSLA